MDFLTFRLFLWTSKGGKIAFPPPSPPCSEEHFNFNLEELSYPKNPKMCDPILVTLFKMLPHYNFTPVVKMRPHPAALPHKPLIRNYPRGWGQPHESEREVGRQISLSKFQ